MRICRGIRISLRVCLRTGRVLSYICSRIPAYWCVFLRILGHPRVSLRIRVYPRTGRVPAAYWCILSRIPAYRPRIRVYLLAYSRIPAAYWCILARVSSRTHCVSMRILCKPLRTFVYLCISVYGICYTTHLQDPICGPPIPFQHAVTAHGPRCGPPIISALLVK